MVKSKVGPTTSFGQNYSSDHHVFDVEGEDHLYRENGPLLNNPSKNHLEHSYTNEFTFVPKSTDPVGYFIIFLHRWKPPLPVLRQSRQQYSMMNRFVSYQVEQTVCLGIRRLQNTTPTPPPPLTCRLSLAPDKLNKVCTESLLKLHRLQSTASSLHKKTM